MVKEKGDDMSGNLRVLAVGLVRQLGKKVKFKDLRVGESW